MKKVILILTVLMCGFNIHAQSIYRMYSNGSGLVSILIILEMRHWRLTMCGGFVLVREV